MGRLSALQPSDGRLDAPESDPARPRGLDELYRAERPRLLRYLERQIGAQEADDVVQESFARLAARGDSDPIERPAAFLRRITVNLLRDGHRRAVRRPIDSAVPDPEQVPAADQLALLESRDMLRRVEAAIGRLKPKTRAIFLAHRVEGRSYAEIAERTGLSIKGVEKQMSKAIAAIDRMMSAYR